MKILTMVLFNMTYETHFDVANPRLIIVILVIIMPVSGLGLDLYVPSLPSIQHYFAINKNLVQLTVSLFILGNAGTQFLFGAISDNHGRRKVLLLGSLFFIVSTLLATLATSIYFLLAMRLLEGISVAACTGSTRAICPDVFKGASYRKVISLMVITWGLGPIVAPFIGGYLQHYFGWRSPFYFLAAYGLVIFTFAWLVLPETHPNPTRVSARIIFFRIMSTLRNPVFMAGSLIGGLCYGIMVVFNVMGPFIMQTSLGKSPIFYGYIALLLGAGYLLGSLLNRLWVHTLESVRMRLTIGIMVVVAVGMLICALTQSLSIWNVVIPTFILFACQGMLYGDAIAKPGLQFPAFRGLATSFCGTIVFMVAFVITVLASFFNIHTLLPLSAIYTTLGLLILLLYFTLFTRPPAS